MTVLDVLAVLTVVEAATIVFLVRLCRMAARGDYEAAERIGALRRLNDGR